MPTVQAYPLFIHAAAVAFDYAASRKLAVGDLGFTGFACHSLLSLRRAKRLGIAHVGLVAPNSHVNNLWRQQNLAQVLYPIDKGWLTNSLRRRTIREYDLADVIFISSEYQKSTFREFGVPDEKLIRIDLTPHPRFRRRASLPATTTFNIAYVGRFDLIKGLPLLIDAFAKAARSDWRLRLMGQFSSYRLRKYVASKIREDSRITLLEYGDPLSVLESAHVYVHPSFEDGFGYAPMEALAVGVPVIVTDQTGMSEYVREGIDGSVIPAGHLEPLVEALKHFSSQ